MATATLVAQHIEALVVQLQQEGVLDEQFTQLMQLQDDSNPDFVAEVVQLYFEDSGTKIDRIGQLLNVPDPDYNELDQLVHQFKGSSASLGAHVIAQLCIRLREQCQQRDAASCRALQLGIRDAYTHLKARLETFIHLEAQRKQLLAAGVV